MANSTPVVVASDQSAIPVSDASTESNTGTIAGAVSSNVMQSNIKNVGGSAVVSAATGVQQVGVVGNAGAKFDQAIGSGAVPANALLIGGQSRTSDISAVSSGNLGGIILDQKGSQVYTPYAISQNYYSNTGSATTTTSTQVLAGVSSNYLYITSIQISNSSNTTVTVALQNGSAGTTIATFIAPATGGSNITFPTPFKVPTSGNGLYFASSSAVSTIYVNATAYAQAY